MVTIIRKGANRKEIESALAKVSNHKGFDPYKHCGVIKLQQDPMEIQKKMRDEWEQRLS